MTLLLVAHGTRDPKGTAAVAAIADAVRARLHSVPVELAFADVRPPTVTEVLDRIGGPAVVVPAFLAAGYHVRVDVPEQVICSGKSDVLITRPLGPLPALVNAVHERIRDAGWRPGDALVLAAAGSTDSRAVGDVRRAATLLSDRIGSLVRTGYLTTRSPRLVDVVRDARRSAARVVVASWLLAPGLFHHWALDSGADAVADPIGPHPLLVDVIERRYRDAVTSPVLI